MLYPFSKKAFFLQLGSLLIGATLLVGCTLTPMVGVTTSNISQVPKVIITPSVTDETLNHNTDQAVAEGAGTPLYVARCFNKSKLRAPYMVGQVIQTPAYALVTVGDADNQGKNSFCVVNKVTIETELTPVNNLTYSKPTILQP